VNVQFGNDPVPSPYLRVGAIAGDGVGGEVLPATLPLLRSAAALDGITVEFEHLDWGARRYIETGAMMPADGVARVRDLDAVIFGAVGHPDVPDHITLWGLLLPLRQELELAVNVRPIRSWPGVTSVVRGAEGTDLVILRENSEGEYAGIGGLLSPGPGGELALEVAVHSREKIERIARHAFQLAERRRGRVTLATKSNSLRHGYVLWDEVVSEVAAEFPLVEWRSALVDALAAKVIESPREFDVIVASNLFGDILSDLAAVLAGGLGMAPSANVDPERRSPGLYEPVHGSAPDIAGRGIANPAACILSAAMLLRDAGAERGAAALESAVELACRDETVRTGDVGGSGTTESFAAAVAAGMGEPIVGGAR
jgi:tartrate dehydrogenase/decarboxylase / D-malate dehydrogenase